MKTITISTMLETEMLVGAKAAGPFALSLQSRAEIIALLAPPVVPPPVIPPPSGDWKAHARAAASVQGLTPLLYEWDWAGDLRKIDVALGLNGIIIARFVAKGPEDSVSVQLSATNYPAAQMVCAKRLTISTSPGNLNPSEHGCIGYGSTPNVAYCVGPAPISSIDNKPVSASLVAGQTYFVNLACRTAGGQSTARPDLPNYPNVGVRLQLQKPGGRQ